MGRGIISPRGFETRPFIPAIWRICWEFPRAPESTIMSSGLNSIADSVFSMARPTSEVADVQISISFWRRSSSVMMPRLNCVSAFSASRS